MLVREGVCVEFCEAGLGSDVAASFGHRTLAWAFSVAHWFGTAQGARSSMAADRKPRIEQKLG